MPEENRDKRIIITSYMKELNNIYDSDNWGKQLFKITKEGYIPQAYGNIFLDS